MDEFGKFYDTKEEMEAAAKEEKPRLSALDALKNLFGQARQGVAGAVSESAPALKLEDLFERFRPRRTIPRATRNELDVIESMTGKYKGKPESFFRLPDDPNEEL